MRFSTFGTAASLLLAVALAGCGRMPGYPTNVYVPPDQVTDFNTLYNMNCQACHGPNGQNGPAIDLANPKLQGLVDDATLRNIITNGMPGTQMPAWARSAGGMLTDAQVNALVVGMRKRWASPNAFGGATPPPYSQPAAAPESGKGTKNSGGGPGNVANGKQLYQAHCESCHAGPKRQQLTSPLYLKLISDQALRSIIIAGRPDIGQPDWRHDNGVLSPEDVTDIVAYLGSLRNSTTISAPPVPLSSRR